MRPCKFSVLLLALFCALLAAVAAAPATAGYEFPICTAPGGQYWPAISANIVVWDDYRNSSTGGDIYGKDLSTGREFPVCTAPGSQYWPAISASIVVWMDDRNVSTTGSDIYGYDLSTGREFPICTTPGDQWCPAISGAIVVWEDYRNGATTDIYGKDLSTGREFAICTAPDYQWLPAISGNIVVWMDCRNSSTEVDIYGKDLATGSEFAVCTVPGTQGWPAISGDIVVWEDWRNVSTTRHDIYGKDLATGNEFAVCTAPGYEWRPAISGNIVVWMDNRNYSTTGWDIYGKDLSTGREFVVCTAPGDLYSRPTVSGKIVVWEDERNYSTTGWDIYGYRLDGNGGPPTTLPDNSGQFGQPEQGAMTLYPTQLHAHYLAERGEKAGLAVKLGWDVPPNKLALMYRGLGYSFAAATEHYPVSWWWYLDHNTTDAFWAKTGREGEDGRICDSFEDTCGKGGTHILGIGFEHTKMSLAYAGQLQHEEQRAEEITKNGGGFAIAAHPNDPDYKWDTHILSLCVGEGNIQALEIFNAGVWLAGFDPRRDEAGNRLRTHENGIALDRWDDLLKNMPGRSIWGTAGDDYTSPWPQLDDGCVVIVSPCSTLYREEALSALRQGAFYACQGRGVVPLTAWGGGYGAPIIDGWWAEKVGEDIVAHVVVSDTHLWLPQVRFMVNGTPVQAIPSKRGDGKYEATYTYLAAQDRAGYVRAEVEDGYAYWPAVSYTQPILISPQGTQTYTWTPQAATTRALEPIVIDFDQAHLEISQPQSNLAGTVYAYLLPPSDRPPSSPPLGYIGSCYRFLPAAQLDGTNLLRLGYDPREVTLYPEATLCIYWFDPDQETWVALPSAVDENAHTATAAITTLGTFAISAPMPEETNPPGISITSPALGAVLAGSTTITADAWDDNGVASVQFYLGDLLLDTDVAGSDGWACTFDASRHPPGAYVIKAVGRDACGNEGQAEVNVTLSGGAAAPTLTLASPASGTTLAPTFLMQGRWSDDEAPLRAIAMLGDAPIGLPVLADNGAWSLNADITGMPPGSYSLTVAGEDAAGNPAGVAAAVQVPLTITGQVRVRGTTTNIASAVVEAAVAGQVKAAAMTGTNGIYQMGALPYGACSLTARKQGYVSQTKPATVSVGQISYVNFNLDVSGKLTGQVRVKGTTTNIEGATVVARSGGQERARTTTGANGIYVIDGDLPAGQYTVSAANTGYATQTKGNVTVTAGATTYLNFFLERAPSVKGQVCAAGTGTPIAGATVSINSWGMLPVVVTATTDAKGIYAFPPGLPSGTYTVWASKAGYVTQTKANITTIEGETRYVNFNLQVSGRLKGQVKDKVSGANLIGATVFARMGGVIRATATTTAPYGVYAINADLPPGTYVVQASQPGYLPQAKKNIIVTAGVTTYVNFFLQPQ